MATFSYEAIDSLGRTRRGVVSADSVRQARKELRRNNLVPMKLQAAGAGSSSPLGWLRQLTAERVGAGEIMLMTRQLATLISAATPIEEALHAIALQTDNATLRQVLLGVRNDVTEGQRMSEAMAKHPRVFSPLYVSLVSAGETSGALAQILERLADHLEKTGRLRGKIRAAMIYPAVLAAVAALTVLMLLIFVVPKVVDQFTSLGQELPWLTRALTAVAAALANYGLVGLAAIGAGVALVKREMRKAAVRATVHEWILKLPLFGRLIRRHHAAHMARTLSTLLYGGVPALDALRAAKSTISNAALVTGMDGVIAAVREGASVSSALRQSGAFPPLLSFMAASGESAGRLDAMLEKAADQLDREFESAAQLMVGLLEPAVIIVMGGIIAVIVLAIMMPIFQLNSMALL